MRGNNGFQRRIRIERRQTEEGEEKGNLGKL